MAESSDKCFYHNRMDYGFMTDYRPNFDIVQDFAKTSGVSKPLE